MTGLISSNTESKVSSTLRRVMACCPAKYSSFNLCTQNLSGLLPIDYFLAKDLIKHISYELQEEGSLVKTTQANAFLGTQQQVRYSELIFNIIVQLSIFLRDGHTCTPLKKLAGMKVGNSTNEDQISNTSLDDSKPTQGGFLFPSYEVLSEILNASNINKTDNNFIVFDSDNLYLRRYYQFEKNLQTQLIQKNNSALELEDINAIKESLDHVFPLIENDDVTEIDWQKIAVANALVNPFCVIAGGPGTGKTYTVTKLLAALVHLNVNKDKLLCEVANADFKICLVAPTGKAAQRLSESVSQALSGFAGQIDTNILESIPTKAQTIHRLLGVIPNRTEFKHNANNKINADVLLVDEVSMVDLPLMNRLFSALPNHCRVILLGDADQLPSVAVGSILSDIAPRPHPGFSIENEGVLSSITGCSSLPITSNNGVDHCVFLTKSRRFDGEAGIGVIANQVINGESHNSWSVLQSQQYQSELSFHHMNVNAISASSLQAPLPNWLVKLIKQYYLPLRSAKNLPDAFSCLSKFRVLCATRKGEQGVNTLNERIEDELLKDDIQLQSRTLYHGKPIMISRNHYGLGLYNGDIGIIWEDESGHLSAVFEMSNNEYQKVLPSRLPEYESVYAMTIHKTQGSEFTHVAMILPATCESKLLSRELLYTGITRAKQHLTLSCSESVWSQGVKTKVERFSGLKL